MVGTRDLLPLLEKGYYFWPGLIIFLIIYSLVSYLYNLWQITITLKWIQKPRGLPIVGNAFDFLGKSSTDRWKKSIEWLDKFSGMVQVWIVHRPTIIVAKKNVVEKLLKGTGDTLTKKSEHYQFMSEIFGSSLLTFSAMDWITRRKLLNPYFNEGELQRCLDATVEHSKVLVSHLMDKTAPSEIIDIQHYARLSAIDLASDMLMKASPNFLEQSNQPYLQVVKTVGEVVSRRSWSPLYNWSPLYLLTLTRILQARASSAINSFTDKVITRRRKARSDIKEKDHQNEKTKDFLDYLLDIEEKKCISEKEVQNEMNTFLFAAQETIGAGVAFTLYLLGLHPDIQEEVAKEIKSNMSKGLESESHLFGINNKGLLDRCIKEALRLYPPVPWIGRYLKNYIRIEGDNRLPEGSSVIINSFKLHRDPELFPRPDQFDPDRPEPPDFAYIPFGAGWRSCIGQNWAIVQMKIMIAHILSSYSIISMDKPENLELIADVVLRSANGLKIRLHKSQ